MKEKRLGSCVCGGEGGRGRWGERREVGELCVYVGERRGWGERREVLHMILFRGGGGGFKIFWKSEGIYMAGGDLSYAFTRGFGGMLPRNFFYMVQPYLKISQPP